MGDNFKEPVVLPDSKSPSLYLSNSTAEERLAVWNLNKVNWGSALKNDEYLEREAYLMTVPLAKDNGVTHWILVDRDLPPNERPILGSCESLRKRSLVAKDGIVTEAITHGVGSVFCNPEYRGKGYASRMLRELGIKLREWQTDKSCGNPEVPFSILYSDIGKKYYASHGWHVFPSAHISLSPAALPTIPSTDTKTLSYAELPTLCAVDEERIRKQLSEFKDGKTYVSLIPDFDTTQWHHLREDFVTSKIFGKTPTVKGAIAGQPGSRVWAIWTRSYYGPLAPESGNMLHILRLVIEDETASSSNAEKLKGILQKAQAEAQKWQLSAVEFWNPTAVIKELVQKTGLEFKEVDREQESIASLMWYGEGKGTSDEITWFANEKYGWC